MRLLSLEYRNTEQEWAFNKIDFFGLTLLVGLSGVGKTQILRSIYSLKDIANGESVNGVEWNARFKTLKGNECIWRGAFENIKPDNEKVLNLFDSQSEKGKPKIVYEELTLDGQKIVMRDNKAFKFNDTEMPRLNSYESAINILKEEDSIKEIYDNLKLIVFRDHTQKEGIHFSGLSVEKLKKKFDTFEKIKESDLDTFHKLALIYDVKKDVFEQIVSRFIDVFPQVEQVKVEPIVEDGYSNFILETTVIQIKENWVDKWIPHDRMSSGMLRTLLHIAELYLWNDGTVILIDEFENSLGVNCIDVVTEDILDGGNTIQFIATSHHPYIINKIPFEYWKVVTRKGGNIQATDAEKLGLGQSHHDRFMSLINHPNYRRGIS